MSENGMVKSYLSHEVLWGWSKFIDVKLLEHRLAESERYVSNRKTRGHQGHFLLALSAPPGWWRQWCWRWRSVTEESVTAQQKHHPSPLVLTPWTSLKTCVVGIYRERENERKRQRYTPILTPLVAQNGKVFACSVGDLGSIPVLGGCSGGVPGNPF